MVFSHPQYAATDAVALRKKAGLYLKQLREEAEMTQLQLSKELGLDYAQMVSHVEIGKARVPPDKIIPWAQAVKRDPREVARELLKFYDPYMWQALFGGTSSASKTTGQHTAGADS